MFRLAWVGHLSRMTPNYIITIQYCQVLLSCGLVSKCFQSENSLMKWLYRSMTFIVKLSIPRICICNEENLNWLIIMYAQHLYGTYSTKVCLEKFQENVNKSSLYHRIIYWSIRVMTCRHYLFLAARTASSSSYFQIFSCRHYVYCDYLSSH